MLAGATAPAQPLRRQLPQWGSRFADSPEVGGFGKVLPPVRRGYRTLRRRGSIVAESKIPTLRELTLPQTQTEGIPLQSHFPKGNFTAKLFHCVSNFTTGGYFTAEGDLRPLSTVSNSTVMPTAAMPTPATSRVVTPQCSSNCPPVKLPMAQPRV